MKASAVTDDATATLVASDIAANANLWVAPNVSNLAISAQITQEVPVATINDTSTSDAPQVVVTPTETSTVQEHTVVEGETVDTLAEKYEISKETIKWANNLTEDSIEPGKIVKILPTDGVSYTVKADDTIEKIAEKYKVSPERLVLFNDLELTGIKEGDSIILPSAELPEEERPGYVAPRTYTRSATSNSNSKVAVSSYRGGSVGNRYARGWCTWYAYERRAQSGRPVGSFWGNANTWASAARGNGYLVNNSPAAGAVFQTRAGGYGHVGYIESVDYANGTVTYSDMNGKAGWNRVGSETISLSEAQSKWTFIH
ncbi:LysM peptidoglycan-binding domain-containing protein [Candidatus Saccharibacteria bacterium]|nr:LysM peptidoglycan-binding domain-containing protein [Candidatus Saccharibacteria bacterium]MBP9986067.1 LysM peptidoglycan-binding domain-containing protein [Candidatus Saccharibacteria bacterium]